jgi:signal transduction histidine kinase
MATAAIFFVDAVTDVNVVVGDLYVVVILLVSRARVLPPIGILLVALGCIWLTVTGYLIGPGNIFTLTAGINLFFTCGTISFTAFIVARNVSTELGLSRLRDDLVQSSRVASLAEITAVLAHDLRQPITNVLMNAQACLRWLAVQPPNLKEARDTVNRMANDSNRASELLQHISATAERSQPQLERVDINDAIREILPLAYAEAVNRDATLQSKLARDLPPARANRIQLQQVVLNLVINALEALDAYSPPPRTVEIETSMEDAVMLRVTVRDSGTGLNPYDLEKIFEPFYTTKRLKMGMGLAVSRSIIQANGGRIWATPNTPRGAIFNFTLPVIPQERSVRSGGSQFVRSREITRAASTFSELHLRGE